MEMPPKYRRGFVAGMFDLFHIGHLDMLRLAKEQCEYLIVAVGTDDFYRWRKKREPVMSYDERREIVAAIRYVNEVVPETDLDKIAAYNAWHFDAMFVSEDHKGEDVYIKAEQDLRRLGVETIYMKRRGISSTALRRYLE